MAPEPNYEMPLSFVLRILTVNRASLMLSLSDITNTYKKIKNCIYWITTTNKGEIFIHFYLIRDILRCHFQHTDKIAARTGWF